MGAAEYEAVWVPGLDSDMDRDESLEIGLRWLAEAGSRYGAPGVIVMYAKQMTRNAPLLTLAARRWTVVSPRSPFQRGDGPVLAIWPPNDRTLELAELLARGTALCVIAGTRYDLGPWTRRTRAECLVEGLSSKPAASLPVNVTEKLDLCLDFGGHNSFLGGGDKELMIPLLREIAREDNAPMRQAIEEYLRASGRTDGGGARLAGIWYAEILEGRRHRDYRGRVIR
jgi:hypothetical protein